MGKLTNGSFMNTGGGIMCYSALYDGKYWVFGATDNTMSAYSIDPLHAVDDEGYSLNEEAYLIPDATDFPTWREVYENIRDDNLCPQYIDIDLVLRDILHYQRSLDFHVNYEFPEDDPTYHKEGE